MKHFKATRTVEVVELDHTKLHSKMPGWFFDAYKEGDIRYNSSHNFWYVDTQEGREVASDGDYVIKNVGGSLSTWTRNKDILKEMYGLIEVQNE